MSRSNQVVTSEILPDVEQQALPEIFQDRSSQNGEQSFQQNAEQNRSHSNGDSNDQSEILQNKCYKSGVISDQGGELKVQSEIFQNQSDQIRQLQVYSEIYPNRSNQGAEINQSIISEIVELPALSSQNILRVFQINNKEFIYDGPKNNVVDELITVLEQLEIQDKKKQNQQHGRLIELINNISKKILFQFIVFNYEIKFDVSQLILTIMYWCVFIYMFIESINFNNKEIVKNNQQLINYLPFIVFLYTLGCQIFTYFNNKRIQFILFIILFLIPSFILLDYYQDYIDNNQQNNQQIGISFCLLCLIIFFKSIFNQVIRRNFKRNSLLLTYTLINCSFYVFSTVFIYFRIIKLFIITEIDINQSLLKIILEDIKAPLFIFLLCYQAILLIDFFRIKARDLFNDLINHTQPMICIQKNEILSFLRKQILRILNFVPYLLTAGLVVLASYLLYFLNLELQQQERSEKKALSYAFLQFLVPFLLFFNAFFSNKTMFGNYPKNYISLPIICNVLSIFSINLWNLMSQKQIFSYISPQVGVLLPFTVCFYLSIRIFKYDQRIIKLLFILISMCFIFFPYFVLLTIAKIQENRELENTSWGLFYFGIGSIGIYCFAQFQAVFYLFFEIQKRICNLTKEPSPSNFVDEKYSHGLLWLVSFNYLAAFHILTYVIKFELSSKESGIFIGLQIINFLLFFSNLKFFENILAEYQQQNSKGRKLEQKLYNKRIQKLIFFSIVFSLFIFFPLYFAIINQTVKFVMLTLTFGIPIVTLYYQFLQNFKTDYKDKSPNYFLFFVLIESSRIMFCLLIRFFQVSTNPDETQFISQLIALQLIATFILILAKVSILYQIHQKDRKKSQKKQEKLFFCLSRNNIILSKKILKRLNTFLMKQKRGYEQIKDFFLEDTEIALLYYKTMDSRAIPFLFVSKLQYLNQKNNQNCEDQKKQNELEIMVQSCISSIFFEKQKISYSGQIRKELATINQTKFLEEKIIQNLYFKECLRQHKLIEPENDNIKKQCSLFSSLLQYKDCCIGKTQQDYLNQSIFQNPKKLQIYLNLETFKHFDVIISTINNNYKYIYSKNRRQVGVELSDLVTFIFRLYDYFTLISIPLDFLILQDENQQRFLENYIDYSFILDNYLFKFTLSLIITGLYLILGLIAIKQTYQNTYGLDDNGEEAGCTNWKYWFCKLIFLINTQIIFVSKTFLNIFFCKITENPHKVFIEPTIICMSDIHINYIIVSIIGLLIFFPLSTFLYPILQYNDKSSNIRFETTYVVYYNVTKLFVVGIQAASLNRIGAASVNAFQSAVVLILAFEFIRRVPCKFQCYNYVELFFLLQIQIFFCGASRAIANENINDGWVLVGIFEAVISFFCLCYSCFKVSESNRIRPE